METEFAIVVLSPPAFAVSFVPSSICVRGPEVRGGRICKVIHFLSVENYTHITANRTWWKSHDALT